MRGARGTGPWNDAVQLGLGRRSQALQAAAARAAFPRCRQGGGEVGARSASGLAGAACWPSAQHPQVAALALSGGPHLSVHVGHQALQQAQQGAIVAKPAGSESGVDGGVWVGVDGGKEEGW